MCCSELQCVAVCCSKLCVAVSCSKLCVAVFVPVQCSVLQCVAVSCRVLQCVAVCCSVCYNVVQCVAVCCSALQCVAVYCSVLPCIAVCCSVLQRECTFQNESGLHGPTLQTSFARKKNAATSIKKRSKKQRQLSVNIDRYGHILLRTR